MRDVFKGDTDCILVKGLEEAVQLASQEAKRGETVLFSPACASFDMFRDYEDRGEKFMEWVRQL